MAMTTTTTKVGGTAERKRRLRTIIDQAKVVLEIDQGEDEEESEVIKGAKAYSFSEFNEHGEITRSIISSFLNQYGPPGNNSLSNDEQGLLFNVAMAMTRKQFQPGSTIGMKVKHLIQSHMNDVAASSGINHTVDGNGDPNASGHTVEGYSSSNYYQQTRIPGDGDDGFGDPKEETGGLETLMSNTLTNLAPEPEKDEEDVKEELTNSNPMVEAETVVARPMGHNAFRSSAAYRTAFRKFQASRSGR